MTNEIRRELTRSVLQAAVVLSVVVTPLVSCVGLSNDNDGSEQMAEARHYSYDLWITCKASVKEVIYVDVLSGTCKEGFGVIGAGPNGRDGGKATAGSSISISQPVVIQWGIKGQDGLEKKHRTQFAMAPYAAYIGKIKALDLIYYGGEKWELKAYDGSPDRPGTHEIKPAPAGK